MPDLCEVPAVEVTISHELRHLFSQKINRIETVVSEGEIGCSGKNEISACDRSDHWQKIVLRCNGGRPLVINGLRLMSNMLAVQTPSGSASVSLEFFIDGLENVFASISVQPPDKTGALPIYRSAKIGAYEELRNFIDICRIESCFDHDIGDLMDLNETCIQMRAALSHVTDMCRAN